MKGKVYLIGAGPGDYKLLTLKALEVIRQSDVIVYDRLANKKILKEAKKSCEFIYVGKKSSDHTMKQKDINQLLCNKAKEGKIVARLKGGDPYVFGRGGEEGEILYDNNVDFEVIPGITSAIGGLCYGGIPITHRDFASSFHVITGHLKDDKKELNWKALASLDGTLVFLMGMKNLKNITENLIKNGKTKDTEVAIINWATRYNQKVLTGNLENIYDKVQEEGIKPPSLIVIGGVVSLRDKLSFFDKKPLLGKNIVVTRARAQSSSLVKKIMDLGGNPIEFPTIRIKEINPNKDLEDKINNIGNYDYVIFTSINGVDIFFNRLLNMGYDSRKLGNIKVVAIGPKTSKALKKYGIIPDIIPEKYVAENIYESLSKNLNSNNKVLIPRSSNARSYLVDKLNEVCYVDEVKTYDTVLGDGNKEEMYSFLQNNEIDYITFTSSSTVKNFISIIGEENVDKLKSTKLISIGPITSETIENFGLKVYREAEEYTIEGVLKQLRIDS